MIIKHVKKFLYVRFLKFIYNSHCVGMSCTLRPFKDVGFKFNPYNKFVENKMKNGSQCTVRWFMGDNNISHIDDNINSTIVEIIKKTFGKVVSITGKKHEVLVMHIKFLGDVKGTITTP